MGGMKDDGEGGGAALTVLMPGYNGTGAGGADGLGDAPIALPRGPKQARGFSLGSSAWFNS